MEIFKPMDFTKEDNLEEIELERRKKRCLIIQEKLRRIQKKVIDVDESYIIEEFLMEFLEENEGLSN